MKMAELFWGSIGKAVYDLNKELIELLTRDWADFEMIETLGKEICNLVRDWSFCDI
jgi:hypothetical protein